MNKEQRAKSKEQSEIKKTRKKPVFPLLSVHCSLFIVLCSLLISCEGDPDFLKKIDEEIAWANADRLTVAVSFPPEWGSSNPQQGTLSPGIRDIRRWTGGEQQNSERYKFSVEFSPMAGFGFEGWLAFPTSEYAGLNKTKSFAEMKEHVSLLNDNGVIISTETDDSTGEDTFIFLISTDVPVTLIPWCTDRPRITHSNPPLISSGFDYTRGQQISITFSMPLKYNDKDEIKFGTDTITISGQNTEGTLWDGNFDEEFFDTPYYDKDLLAIIITPIKGNEPPEYYNITVTVGTGIYGENGYGLSSQVKFSYRTSRELVTRAYKASNIWASHDPQNDRRVESFFYQTAPSDRDRRLRKKADESYDVSLFFNVSRSMGEIEYREPNALSIVLIHYAALDGTVKDVEIENRTANYNIGQGTFVSMNTNENTAGGIYRQMNNTSNPLGVYFFEATYNFPKTIDSGIYRLVVLPYRRDGSNEQYKDKWEDAVAESRFVTVVIDKDPPNTDGSLSFSGYTMISRRPGFPEDDIYRYSPNSSFMTITSSFLNVRDNGSENGILPHEATPNIPWTMDENRNLKWRWNITFKEVNPEGITDRVIPVGDWLPIGTSPPPFNLAQFEHNVISNENNLFDASTIIYTINVQFSDSLDNPSDEKEMGKIIYTSPPPAVVPENWNAVYNPASRTIIVSWTSSSVTTDSVDLSYTVNGAARPVQSRGHGSQQVTIFEVSNVIHEIYDIKLIAKKGDDSIELPFTIVNATGGMTVNAANPVTKITTANIALMNSTAAATGALGGGNDKKQWVLTEDITLNSWTPSGTTTNQFYGKFYGNGHTIKINSFATSLTRFGFFGTVNNAVISDLKIEYPNEITLPAGTMYFGGIAASSNGGTFRNSTVQGSSGRILVNVPAGTTLYAGSITGFRSGTVTTPGCSGSGLSITGISPRQASVRHWVMGTNTTQTANPLLLDFSRTSNDSLSAVMDVFIVDNFNDDASSATTQGTLRHAITRAINNDTIRIGTPNATILLATPLQISSVTGLIIEGNGLTLTPAASWSSNTESQLFRITNSSASVTINRVHFKDGKANDNGGAIRNSGTLTLVSCIFSGNVASNDYAWGGAIYNMRTMTVIGCTFYNNRANRGGAIYTLEVGELNLSGNLFYENRASNADGRHIVHASSNNYAMVTSNGYNVVDVPLGTQSGGSGFDYAIGDITFASVLNSNLTSPFFSTTGATAYTLINITSLHRRIPSTGTWASTNMPPIDFYGNARTWPGPPGAVVQNAPAPTNPTNIFREDFEGTNSFTIENGSVTNQWRVGTATRFSGTRSAYISNDNGTSNAYTITRPSPETAGSIVHMHREVTFPAGTGPYTLTFDVRVQGEGETWYLDFLRVFLVETSVIPVASVGVIGNAGNKNTGVLERAGIQFPLDTVLGTYNLLGPDWTTVNISIPASNAGTTKHLVFTWRNDNSAGYQPPVAVDNIVLWY